MSCNRCHYISGHDEECPLYVHVIQENLSSEISSLREIVSELTNRVMELEVWRRRVESESRYKSE